MKIRFRAVFGTASNSLVIIVEVQNDDGTWRHARLEDLGTVTTVLGNIEIVSL